MSDDARVHLRADKSHVQAYLEYLRVSQRSHSDPLLSEAEYAKAMEQSGGAVERRRKMTEAEEMAVYEKNYQARVRRQCLFREKRTTKKTTGPSQTKEGRKGAGSPGSLTLASHPSRYHRQPRGSWRRRSAGAQAEAAPTGERRRLG